MLKQSLEVRKKFPLIGQLAPLLTVMIGDWWCQLKLMAWEQQTCDPCQWPHNLEKKTVRQWRDGTLAVLDEPQSSWAIGVETPVSAPPETGLGLAESEWTEFFPIAKKI